MLKDILEEIKKSNFIFEKEFDKIDEDKIIFHDERFEFRYIIPFYTKVFTMMDKIIFRKSFIIDLRSLNEKIKNAIFDNNELFQESFGSWQYFRDFSEYPFDFKNNMELIFLYDEKTKVENQYKIMYDMNFMVKKFMTAEELKMYLEKDFYFAKKDHAKRVVIDDVTYELRNFNYLCGLNGSGKTVLIKKMSDKLKVPVFNLNQPIDDLIKYIEQSSNIKKYLYNLTGTYDVGIYSNYEKYIHRLSEILAFSEEHKNILILDDLNWYGLDDLNKIKLIDTLYEYSINNTNVLVTGSSEDVKRLIKARTYNSNIIDL